jgi:tellurite methyltransferase
MATGDRDRWNDKWAVAGVGTGHGSKLLDLLEPWLPESGRVLDIAGGGSSDSLEFARRGFDVTVADVSDVGLIQARQRAMAEDLVITTVEVDLETEPLPAGPWDVITVANYLQRGLFPAMTGCLAPGGILGVVIATTTNLERREKPSRPFLLDPGELPGLVEGLEILHHSENWRPNDRHEAHLVARHP